MPSPGLSVEAIERALLHFQTVGPSDIHPLSTEHSLLLVSPMKTAQLTAQLLDEPGGLASQRYLPPLIGHVEIGEGRYRKSLYVDPLLDVMLTSLVGEIAPLIEQSRVATKEEVVFSYRWNPKEGEWFDSDIGWGAFAEAELAGLRQSSVVGLVDISQFYEAVRPNTLREALHFAQIPSAYISGLIELLNLCKLEDFGLPVGGTASRILAEACLNPIDHSLLAQGVRFIRFVDDYRIFADDERELKNAVLKLTKQLGMVGLSINKSKTRFLNSEEYAAQREVKPSPRFESTSPDTLTVINDNFDPYSQLIGKRVEQLKAISNTQNLHDTFLVEFEKLEPSYRSLKLLFTALQFAPVEDVERCLTLIFKVLEKAKLNRLSFTLERVVFALHEKLSRELRETLCQLMWAHLNRHIDITPEGTVCHWIRVMSHLSDSIPQTKAEEWMSLLSKAEGSLLLQREVYRFVLLMSEESVRRCLDQCQASGTPWLTSLCMSLGFDEESAMPCDSSIEKLMRRLL